MRAFNKLTDLFPRFSGDGFTPAGGTLRQTVTVPAADPVRTKVQLGFVAKEIPASATAYTYAWTNNTTFDCG